MAIVLSNVTPENEDSVDEFIGTQNTELYSFCRPVGLLHDTVTTKLGSTFRSLVVSLALWNTNPSGDESELLYGAGAVINGSTT